MLPRLLRWSSICLQCQRPRFDHYVRKIPLRRKWQPIPVFLPENSHRQRNLIGYSPWGLKELDTTEQLHFTAAAAAKSLQLCLTLCMFKDISYLKWDNILIQDVSASLVTQTVKSLTAVWETQIRSLGQEDPLEKEMEAPTPVFLPGKSHGQRKQAVHGDAKSQTALNDFISLESAYIQPENKVLILSPSGFNPYCGCSLSHSIGQCPFVAITSFLFQFYWDITNT